MILNAPNEQRREQERVEETNLLEEKKQRMEHIPPTEPVHYRCPALTEAQQEQCIHLFHCAKFGSHLFPVDAVDVAHAALLQFVLHDGSWPHLVTVYEQSQRFVGYGDKLRNPQQTEETMSNHVRNRCRKLADGQLVGSGGPGGKGVVYAPRNDRPIYNPKKQHKRGLADNLEMGVKRMRDSGASDTL